MQGEATASQLPTSAEPPKQQQQPPHNNNNNVADVTRHKSNSKAREHTSNNVHANDVIMASSDAVVHASSRASNIPAKPPRKKRPAPLPPSAMTSSPERAPAQVSPQTASSHTDSGVDGDVERRDVTVVHSRSSSRSSGFDSTSSPATTSHPAKTSDKPGAAKASHAQKTMTKSKKRKAPPPPGMMP